MRDDGTVGAKPSGDGTVNSEGDCALHGSSGAKCTQNLNKPNT